MAASVTHFRKLVCEIQSNSWWKSISDARPRVPIKFVYRCGPDGESATEVPNEPFDSLVLRVRRLTMDKSCENLHSVRGELGRIATHSNQRRLLDAWHKYWRIAFIKEPYYVEHRGVRQIMTPYKVYDMMINGRLFHSNSREYNIILYGAEQPTELGDPWLFLQTQFQAVVADFCLAAVGLAVWIDAVDSGQLALSGHVTGVTDFVWCRNRLKELDEQYAAFNDWIEANGGCSKCRW